MTLGYAVFIYSSMDRGCSLTPLMTGKIQLRQVRVICLVSDITIHVQAEEYMSRSTWARATVQVMGVL